MQIFKSLLIVISSLVCLFIVLSTIAVAEEPVHPGYPFVFDVTGKLDRISDKKLVIDDDLFRLSSSTTYHAYDTIFTKPGSFKKKDVVGIILKDKNTREILSVWLIKKAN